jgi:hypothetical protein
MLPATTLRGRLKMCQAVSSATPVQLTDEVFPHEHQGPGAHEGGDDSH